MKNLSSRRLLIITTDLCSNIRNYFLKVKRKLKDMGQNLSTSNGKRYGYIKDGKYLDQLCDFQILNKGSHLWFSFFSVYSLSRQTNSCPL
jgi:hypothetical protein